jgi:hypothetical protein
MSLSADDAIEIHELVARYAHLIDGKAFRELGLVFADDATFDASDFGRPPRTGIDAIIDLMAHEHGHPLAHHSTNVVLEGRSDGSVDVRSKGLAVLQDGSLRSLTYEDVAIRTMEGWRIQTRIARAMRTI